ncbi:MAG: DUF1735 domain-containing protein [Bacteroidales bacterium]|nr:DUF1735 domain-containing protein [Bacteroidales bacterium]
MKKFFAFFCTLGLLAGCIADDRGNFMVDDSFGLTTRETLVQASVHTGSYTIGVSKNGVGQKAASASVSLEDASILAALDKYNGEYQTSYKLIPASWFSLSRSNLEFGQKEVVKDVTVSWDAGKLAEFIGESTDYVLPVCVKSSDLNVSEAKQVVFVRLIRSSLSIAQKSISRVVDRTKVEPDKQGNVPQLKETVILDLKMDNFIKNVGLECPLKIDNSLIESYNQGQEQPFVAAPAGLVTLETPSVTIPEGGEGATFKITIDKSLLLSGGTLQPFPNYLVPVTIDTDAIKATEKGKDFQLSGLAYGSIVTYVAITYLEIKPGLSVRREWGYYSTADASWSDFISGFTAGSERNVAMDDDYIYLAETNQTKHIWAISRTAPEQYRSLPVGTVADEGTFYVSCPRVMKNNNPEINGGRDVLVVSNMNSGDPKLYVYGSGIDNDPSVLSMQTWASRRLGDTFTTWGTFQEGMLFFKDFDSAQGTVTFKLSGKTSGSLYLVGRIVAPPVTGAGAYFPFPDNINEGVASTRGGATAWLTKASKNLWTLEGADASPSLTELSGYFADTAYRFFDFGGKRYIAYTRQVSSGDGRLFILEGEITQGWSQILQERNVVYHAAIQNDTEQEGISEEPSPRTSGNSGMDLDVRQVGDDMYIVVVKQNVGLSLFRMMMN